MKNFLPLLVVGLLVLGGLGAIANTNEKLKIERFSIMFSEPIIQNDEEYISLSFKESNDYLMNQGKPMIPNYIHTFNFPFKTKIKSVTCTPSNIQSMPITKDIVPTPEPVILGETYSTSKKVTINYGVEPYPSNWFQYNVRCGLYKGELSVIVKVEFNPVIYYPAEKIIEWAENANIVIQYESPKEQTTVPEQYQLVIIAPDEYNSALAPLINHKISRGITTKFAGLNEVYSGIGSDNQEKIKYYIKDAIEDWGTTNVLLVGSNSKLPGRITHVHCVDSQGNHDYELFVSDLYYADIYDSNGDFCDWDYNGNGVYGEYDWDSGCTKNCDEVDLLPDVYIGRLACRTTSEVNTVVNKIMNYENNEAYLQNWFKNLVLVGGDSFPDNDGDINEGEYMNHFIENLMDGFSAIHLNVTNGKLLGIAPTGLQNMKNTINEGCGFLDLSGHGNTYIWATHPHLNFNLWLPTPAGGIRSGDAITLTNGDMLPIVVVEACDTARFDTDPNCFNWAFMYNSNGGAIATFGATGLGWGYVGKYVENGGIGKMEYCTFKGYKLDKPQTLGEMWANALDRFIDSHMDDVDFKTTEEWQIFGDPTLQIAPESGSPLKPVRPSGSTTGEPGTAYAYTTSTTDPEDDDISYIFDWGDGTNSGWVGPYTSGETATATHSWDTKKTYLIKVQARDEHDKLSEWSDELAVTIPRTKSVTPQADGTFTAQMGIRNNQDPEIFLEGFYKIRGQYKGIWGNATIGEKQGNIRGLFTQNHFFLRFICNGRTIFVIGRVTFDGNQFTGNWIGRLSYIRGWIEGEFNPS